MASNLDRYKADFERLIKLGDSMLDGLKNRPLGARSHTDTDSYQWGDFENEYQGWYSESLTIIGQLLPTRLHDFEALYTGNSSESKLTEATYSIHDWMKGAKAPQYVNSYNRVFDAFAVVYRRFSTQLGILRSVERRFESALFDMRQLVQADLFDSELDSARELCKHNFLRAAGAIAGVVLEKHLRQVCDNHGITFDKKKATISALNDALKAAGVVDTPTWRQIQRLGDIRKLCDHGGEREPTRQEIDELIDGVDKLTKTLF